MRWPAIPGMMLVQARADLAAHKRWVSKKPSEPGPNGGRFAMQKERSRVSYRFHVVDIDARRVEVEARMACVSSARVLVARILTRCLAALFSSGTDPLRVAAGATFERFLRVWVGSYRHSSTDDVVGIDLADLVRYRTDDVLTKLAVLTHVFAFEAELLLLGHVVPSDIADLGHDVV